MRLGARVLMGVSSPNHFSYADHAEWTEGDAAMLYLQLVDLTQDSAVNGFHPAGRRFIPDGEATLMVTFESRDKGEDSNHGSRWGPREVIREAVQPFPGDPSIWSVQVLPTDNIRGTVSLGLVLQMGSEGEEVTLRGRMQGLVRVHALGAVQANRIAPSWWIGW